MKHTFSIRLATVLDIAVIRNLWRDFVTDLDAAYPSDVLAGIDDFTRSCATVLAAVPTQTFAFLASNSQQEPIGFLIYEIQHRALGQPARYAFVHYCYVAPPYREAGVAGELGAAAGEHALAQGIEHFEVTHPMEQTVWDHLGCTRYEVRAHMPIAAGIAKVTQRRAQEKRRARRAS